MIVLSRVKKTRGGDSVLFSAYDPTGSPGMRIIAVIRDKEEGLSADYFYENGQYHRLGKSDYDLVEEIEQASVSLDRGEEVGYVGVEAENVSNKACRSSHEDLREVLDALETAYQALSVLLRESKEE